MKITQLRLQNFRNIVGTELRPDPHLNFLVGRNAQGKTSVVESLGLLATLQSFRNAKSIDLIQKGTDWMLVDFGEFRGWVSAEYVTVDE